ncbi:bacterial regulatory s, gntR family protein [Mycobacterium intracellulare]|nr:bacterial regulatory s, gntR family protein [Mycobacterium intracellulare]
MIRSRIFDGTYAADSYVRLDQLAAELGISVTPVREALFALRAEGLIAQQPRRGFVVLPVTGRDVTDVANVQAHVGGELAARAAVNITDDQLRELKEIQAQLENAYAGDEHEPHRRPEPRISPGHQHRRRFAQAGAADVANHPLRTRIGVSRHRGLARAVDEGPSSDLVRAEKA